MCLTKFKVVSHDIEGYVRQYLRMPLTGNLDQRSIVRQITTCGFLNQADWRSKIDRDRQQRLREVMDEFFARFVVSTTMRKSRYMIGAHSCKISLRVQCEKKQVHDRGGGNRQQK